MTDTDAVVIEATGSHQASVIWLHGLGADGHDFEPVVPELALPREAGIRFVFPNAPMRPVTINGGMMMRAWYDIKDPDLGVQRERAEFDDSATVVEHFIRQEMATGIDSRRIVVAGFSQGGAIALHAGLQFSETLAGFLILSSYLPFYEVLENDSTQANRDTPILMLHGEFDPVIPVAFARQSSETLAQAGYSLQWQTYPMQHGLCLEEIARISAWLRDRLDLASG